MLDHVTIGVSDIGQSMKFYDRALRPLGIARLYGDGERFAGYGISPRAFFWIGSRNALPTGAHIAFAAQDRATVDRFHDAAMAAGTMDSPEYAPTTIPIITERSSLIPTATISRRSAVRRKASPHKIHRLKR